MVEGGLMVTVGGVFPTAKVPLGPAAEAKFPARSLAVPAAIEMPNVPSPVIPETVTVRVVPLPLIPSVPLAVPVLFNVTAEALNVLD